MIFRIARREITLQIRDGRLILACCALMMALAAAAVSGWTQFQQAEHERAHFTAEARDQWLSQGERHPHRAAHFGMYVTKPEFPLGIFEPGLRSVAGQTLWLEAHDRPAFANIPAEDNLTLNSGLGISSGSAVLQVLGGLLALIMGSLTIVRERETGVLRQILAQGTSLRRWVTGKYLSCAAVLLIPILCVCVPAMTVAVAMADVSMRPDVATRAILLIGVNIALICICLAVGIAISAINQSSRGAMMAALAIWIASFILMPRVVSSINQWAFPAPTLEAYVKEIRQVFAEGFDERGGYEPQLRALEQATMQQYGVSRLADLPVGFSGLRMKHMDSWGSEVEGREYSKLLETYAKQAAVRAISVIAAPFIAARSASQGMAGMDWAHYRHFLEAAEQYRRKFALQMNTLIEERVQGERWETDGTNADWAQVAAFEYAMPTASWAVMQQKWFLLGLGFWAIVAVGLMWATIGRLRP